MTGSPSEVRGVALLIAALTVIVRLVAAAKELAIAAWFGVGSDVDALILAAAVPVFLVGVLASSLPAALVPVMARLQLGGREDEQRLLIEVLAGRVLSTLVLLSLLLALLAPWLAGILAPQAYRVDEASATGLFLLLAPTLLLSGYASYWGGVLNGIGRFAVPALSPVVTPLVVLVALVLRGHPAAVETVAYATLLGGVIEVVAISLYARSHGLGIRPRLGLRGTEWYDLPSQYTPMLVGSALMSSTVLVDQLMTARLGAGAVAVLNYASKVPLLLVGLLGTALATASLPVFSRFAACDSLVELRSAALRLARTVMVATLILAAVLWVSSDTIVRVLFERGAFDASATEEVAWVQGFAALQIPFFCISLLAARMLSALRRNSVLMWGSALSVILNVALNWWLGGLMGAAGIALSTALVYATSMVLLWSIAVQTIRVRHAK